MALPGSAAVNRSGSAGAGSNPHARFYRDQEAQYEEIQTLKTAVNNAGRETSVLKARLQRAEEQVAQKDRKLRKVRERAAAIVWLRFALRRGVLWVDGWWAGEGSVFHCLHPGGNNQSP